jgi:hypothetical protein
MERMDGNVFGRESSGAYAIQLNGFPGMIRVYPLCCDNPIRNVSMMHPASVTVNIVTYDNTTQVFQGHVTHNSQTTESVAATSNVARVDSVRPIPRRLKTMVL